MSAPHPRIVYALPPKRRRVAKARPSRQEVPAIVGPEPQRLEPDAETLARADKADALFRELVRQGAIMLCHPDMDLEALGTPPHEAEPRVVA
jgi:hypothetical protein